MCNSFLLFEGVTKLPKENFLAKISHYMQYYSMEQTGIYNFPVVYTKSFWRMSCFFQKGQSSGIATKSEFLAKLPTICSIIHSLNVNITACTLQQLCYA